MEIPSRNGHQSMNQTSPSETHFVSQVAPIVETMTSLTTFRIGMDIASIAKTGMIVATKR